LLFGLLYWTIHKSSVNTETVYCSFTHIMHHEFIIIIIISKSKFAGICMVHISSYSDTESDWTVCNVSYVDTTSCIKRHLLSDLLCSSFSKENCTMFDTLYIYIILYYLNLIRFFKFMVFHLNCYLASAEFKKIVKHIFKMVHIYILVIISGCPDITFTEKVNLILRLLISWFFNFKKKLI
jgi:hypothetical protein